MEFVPLVLLGALVYKFVDFLKYLRVGDWNAAGTQAIAWVAGIVAVILFAATDFGKSIDVGGQALSDLNFASTLVIGLSATSLFSTVYDLKSAVDRTDSGKTPALVTDTPSRKTLRQT